MTKSPDFDTYLEESIEARQLHKQASDGFVRLLMVVPATDKQYYRAYFSNSAGEVRHVTLGLSHLDRPSDFKKRIRAEHRCFVRHISEFIPPWNVPAVWRTEVNEAMAAGKRFLEKTEAAL